MMIRLFVAAAALTLATRAFAGTPADVQCFTPVESTPGPGGLSCTAIVPLAGHAPPGGFERGCAHVYVIKAGDSELGNWGYLDSPQRCGDGPCSGSSGSTALECALAHGYACTWGVDGGWARTLPGARRGALRDGMQARFDGDTDQRHGICYAQYSGNGNRVIVIPLTDDLANGRHIVEVVRFAAFFLRGLAASGDDAVEAEFLYHVIAD